MTLNFFVTVIIIVLCNGVIGLWSYKEKNLFEVMDAMMIAMAMAMISGLLSGTMFGVLFPDNLFLATWAGMLLGGFAGTFIGAPLQYLAFLDGLFGGVMGGMMGAMLGVMVPVMEGNQLIAIFFILFLFTTFYILSLIASKSRKNAMITNPLYAGLLFVLILLVWHQMGVPVAHQ